ncbi:predicted protein [Chaetoceros tenuissimus]|uniref:Uncharacterized protein n=1 Tax=Chaetoceros tenuissimus TaxID=426638 RepID=A0AAD3CSN2_9STRA|nr:predicted protein [Chaetoceros tenuissimus]
MNESVETIDSLPESSFVQVGRSLNEGSNNQVEIDQDDVAELCNMLTSPTCTMVVNKKVVEKGNGVFPNQKHHRDTVEKFPIDADVHAKLFENIRDIPRAYHDTPDMDNGSVHNSSSGSSHVVDENSNCDVQSVSSELKIVGLKLEDLRTDKEKDQTNSPLSVQRSEECRFSFLLWYALIAVVFGLLVFGLHILQLQKKISDHEVKLETLEKFYSGQEHGTVFQVSNSYFAFEVKQEVLDSIGAVKNEVLKTFYTKFPSVDEERMLAILGNE